MRLERGFHQPWAPSKKRRGGRGGASMMSPAESSGGAWRRTSVLSRVATALWAASVAVAPCSAAGTIAGVAGTVANGEQVAISGSGFGTGPVVVLFDDFELGTDGSVILTGSGSARVGQWNALGETKPTYSSASEVSGNLAFRADMSSHWLAYAEALLPVSTRDVFVSWNLFLPSGDNIPGEGTDEGTNWKQLWIQGQDSGDDDLVTPTILGYTSFFINGNDNPYTKWITLNFSKGTWLRMFCWIKGGASSDGGVKFYEVTSGGIIARANDSSVSTLYAEGYFERVRVNGYGRVTSNSHPMFDDVYIAAGPAAQARVELGNDSSYYRATRLATSTPTSWADGQISATVRTGGFKAGEAVYLFVVTSDGVPSAGFPVTIGGSSSVEPPAVPDNLRRDDTR